MSDAEKLLLDFLVKHPDQALRVTPKKFCERGRIIADKSRQDLIVFEVERHRAMPGSVYTEGLPMASFQTYLAKYVFDPFKQDLTELKNEEVSLGITIDHHMTARAFLLEFPIRVSPVDDSETERRYRVEASGLIIAFEVSTLEEAQGELEQKLRKLDFVGGFTGLEDFDETDVKKWAEKEEEATVSVGLECLLRAWEAMLEEEEDRP